MDSNRILRSDYLDIIFDGRNKTYGGYELRKKYPQRVRNAAMLLFGMLSVLVAYPVIAGMLDKHIVRPPAVSAAIIELKEPPPIDNTRPTPPPPPPAPPAPLPPPRPAIKMTTPDIEEDEKVREQDKLVEMPSADLNVGLVNREGDPNGVFPPMEPPKSAAQVEGGGSSKPHVVVEQMPSFKGDLPAYLASRLRYPDADRERGKEGRSVLQFIVNEDGSITGVEILRSSGSATLDAEAASVIAGMPPWNAGKQQGKPVKVYFRLPITFELN